MRCPEITHAKFLVLTSLIDGRPKTPREARREVNWPTTKNHFSILINEYLVPGGLVRQTFVVRQGEGKSSKRRGERYSDQLLTITESGRMAWQEAMDFYLFIASQWGPERKEGNAEDDGDPVLDEWEIEPKREYLPDRVPDSEEEKKLLSFASREFTLVYRAIRETGLPADDLAALEVGNVDLAGGFLTLPNGRRMRMTGTLRQIFSEAIGKRKSGAVFLSPRGRAWKGSAALGATYRRCRDKAGLARNVKLQGRTGRTGPKPKRREKLKAAS